MRVLVTGGGGFLGSVIVKKLLERGDRVRVLGRRKYPYLEKLNNLETVTADIRNPEAVVAAAKNLDVIVHVASMTGIWGEWKNFFETNVMGTKNVLNACKENKISRLIYTSSPSVIYAGNSLENVDETISYPPKYNCHYSATKAMAEKMVLAENNKNGLLTVALRPHLIWGPGDTNLIPRLIERAKSGRLIRIGDGKNMVDLVYVDNAAYAHLLAIDRLTHGSPVCGQAYFISQGKPVFLWDWINEVLVRLKLSPVKRAISYNTAYRLGILLESIYTVFRLSGEPQMTRFLASQLAKSHFFNIEKAKKELGYYPAVSNEEGLENLVKYFGLRIHKDFRN